MFVAFCSLASACSTESQVPPSGSAAGADAPASTATVAPGHDWHWAVEQADAEGSPVRDGNTLWFVYRGRAQSVQTGFGFAPPVVFKEMEPQVWVGVRDVPDLDHATITYDLQVDDKEIHNPLSRLAPLNDKTSLTTWRGPEVPAHPETQVRPDVPHGKVEQVQLQSTNLGAPRTVRVYLPPDYQPGKAYPLVLCFDAQIYFTSVRVPTVLDNLIHDGKAPPAIVVGVDSDLPNRFAEYLPNGNRFAQNQKFILDELLPWIDTHYGKPAYRLAMGLSNGGELAAYTTIAHSDLFDGAILHGFATNDGHLPDWGPKKPRFYIVIGTLDQPTVVQNAQALRTYLEQGGVQVTAVQRPAGHDPEFWAEELGAALHTMLVNK